jgi:hypothetical protein
VDPGIIAAGLVIGVLVGLTGMGGGSLTTPFLILFADVKPVVAVGTDLIYSAVTKWVGAGIHLRQRTVDLRLAGLLALGSVPASIVGVRVVGMVGEDGDRLVTHALGATLIVVAIVLLGRRRLTAAMERRRARLGRSDADLTARHPAAIVALGVLVGFLVGLTSVGSGTLVVAALLILIPALPPARLVGTDILQAAVLTSAAGIAHWSLGNVDLGLAGALLIGSVPGVVLGSRLSVRLPERVMRPALAGMLLIVAIQLL